ncbi:MAG: 50S ribosomal protein L6 [Nanoarchaeota archaeon]|jgi:large subunit ribosomal protein L6|nr:50S ribosomal protein L6 [Nanoarchaeota archaeon]|tara:strand:- start:24430 stop:24978 length:549 start_codon:yes stop_codon:yes gene_type:complete
MRLEEIKKEIEIPEGVEVKIEDKTLTVKGPKGENQKTLLYPSLSTSVQDNKVALSIKNATKKDKTMIGTFQAHVRNLIKGIREGFIYKIKVCSGHFPMTLANEDNTLVINNFMGEKVPRKAKILSGVEVNIEGDIITLSSFDKEKVGQSAANIELATRRAGFDKRVFQDGCYIIEKAGKEIK